MTERGPARNAIHADLFTDVHRITCQIELGSTGLVGLLNDVNSSLFTARNAYFSRLNQPSKIIANFEEIYLVKAHVAIGLVNRREDLGPAGLFRPSGARTLSAPILLTTTTFEVRGTTEFSSRIDPDAILVGGANNTTARYTVLYNVTLAAAAYPDLPPYSANAMVINRTYVTGMGILTKGKA